MSCFQGRWKRLTGSRDTTILSQGQEQKKSMAPTGVRPASLRVVEAAVGRFAVVAALVKPRVRIVAGLSVVVVAADIVHRTKMHLQTGG